MLNQNDIKSILDLRSQGNSYEKIHKKKGFSKDKIMKVCQQDEKHKKQEKKNNQREITNDKDPIKMTRKIENDISKLLETGNLDNREKRKWKKRLEEIRTILRLEVYDRIPNEISDAIEKRDGQWFRDTEKNYVRKDIVENLNTQIKEKDEKIIIDRDKINEINRSLKEMENEKLNFKKTKDREIQEIKDQSGKLYNKNIDLENQIYELQNHNLELQNYIDKQLYSDCKIKRNHYNKEINAFIIEKKDFSRYQDNQKVINNHILIEEQGKLKTLEEREKKLDKKEEEIEKRENELYKTSKKFFEYVKENKMKLKQMYDWVLEQLYFIKKACEQQKNEETIIN
jgi:hypothetical protein